MELKPTTVEITVPHKDGNVLITRSGNKYPSLSAATMSNSNASASASTGSPHALHAYLRYFLFLKQYQHFAEKSRKKGLMISSVCVRML